MTQRKYGANLGTGFSKCCSKLNHIPTLNRKAGHVTGFSIVRRIESCKLTKRLVIQIEEYLVDKARGLIPNPKLDESYGVTFVDDVGTHTMPSISRYIGNRFPDGMRCVILRLSYDSYAERLRVELRFDRSPSGSRLSIDYEADDPRVVVIGMSDDLKGIIHECSNHNWLFHPAADCVFPFGLLIGMVFGGGLLLAMSAQWRWSVVLFLVVAAAFAYMVTGRIVRPYVAFDSPRADYRERWAAALWAVTVTLALSILGTFIWNLVLRLQ